jgi:hypothetical protein
MPLATGWSAPFAPRSNFKPGDDSFVSFAAIQGSDGKPPEPDWRTIFSNEDDLAIATEAWGFVVRELGEAGTLALANGHAIRRLVEFRVQYERASRQVAERGALLPPSNKKTKVGQWNPYWSVCAKRAPRSRRSRPNWASRRSAAARPSRCSEERKRRGRQTRTSSRFLVSQPVEAARRRPLSARDDCAVSTFDVCCAMSALG